ncbi:hypothetical protein GCM10007301_43990 [Azorhizobium oxalatiphilum]|uniref:Uncharacterized protein n=1 Tax=Azorhizobium oxalatiphilum TaxID=980631 RepID=A0A917C979_9HYPH|nr:hypothetical protein [Azorhizobium oxalatiphilum]GGF79178.1 hypothetical protein GCM10007301_43990 [Azorhizobium oxalatiphilum]
MFGFLKRRSESSIPPDPEAWQRRWHAILDGYDHPEDDEKGVPDPLPDMMEDFRLQFAFWHSGWADGAAARKQAFAILPRGDDMLARVEIVLATPPQAIGPEEAQALLRPALAHTRALGLDAPDPEGPIRVLVPELVALQEAFGSADTPFIDLRDRMPDLARAAEGEVGEAAYFFLSEPLYRLATAYDVSAWVLWPLCAPPDAADPTEAGYRLWQGGWSAGWDGEGLFLYDRRAELRLV